MNSQTIALTILEQLGGRRFVAMTGAKNLLSGPNALSFRLPSYLGRNGINAIRITLLPNDLYRVEFTKVRGVKFVPVSVHESIYGDELQALFTRETGLATRL